MKPKTPKAIKNGHENLCSELQTIVNLGGKIGEKAKFLEEDMYPHFEKEEKYALPPLGLLLALSEGNWDIDSNVAIEMSDMLQLKLSELTKEHENILRALQDFRIVAHEEDIPIAKQFVKDLMLHIEVEDQVLYPATILIGNYLRHLRSLS